MGLGAALGLGAQVLGALGGGKRSTEAMPTSGYATAPKKVKDFSEGDLFEQILNYNKARRLGLPMRGADDRETDPIFGSRARMDLGRILGSAAPTPSPQAASSGNADQMMASQLLNMALMQGGDTKLGLPLKTAMQSMDSATYQDLLKALMGAQLGTGINAGGFTKDGELVDVASIFAKRGM